LSIADQCKLFGISRSTYYYQPSSAQEDSDLPILLAIKEVLEVIPFYGYRRITKEIQVHYQLPVSRKQVRRIMNKCGLRAIYPKRNLSKGRKEHKKYPYLLRGKVIWLPNQAWCSDITYCHLNGHHVYLVAIMDIYSRKVLSWRLSNTMDTQFCIDALEEAITNYGQPSIFNTDQGSQFTSERFTKVLHDHNIQISMDGKGRALDNVYIERVWRSVKYENVFLHDYKTMTEMREGLKRYFTFYNSRRFHQSHDYGTPDEMYHSPFTNQVEQIAA
jgi:putative transposase